MATEKAPTPAYGSPKSFNTFFDARREDGHITTVVDRSLMSSFSGSTANELLASLKFLKMIGDKGEPTPRYAEYVQADDEARKGLLAQAIRDSYTFLWNTPGFDIERGTTAQMAEAFRAQGITGSTLARAVSFFLAMAKQVGIKVSPNIKAPHAGRNASSARPKKDPAVAAVQAPPERIDAEDPPPPSGYQIFTIPIPINRRVLITIPKEWSSADWDLLQTMLSAYVTGWKSMADTKDKGSAPVKEKTL